VKARALVDLWRALRSTDIDVFAPEGAARLKKMLPPEADSAPVLAAVRALEIVERERAAPSTVSFVGTRPRPKPHEGGTRSSLRDLIASAQRELLVVGFSMTDPEIERLVQEKARSGVHVTLVGDRQQEGLRAWLQRWPPIIPRPVALVGVEPDENEPFQMHGKAVVADRQRALVGSANFTAGGLQRNVELGLRVDGAAAREVVNFIERLADERWLIQTDDT
jgi:phosphatidylserine/phosphatidylglycerophosphate/cardiolipin synthase-like enzyme